MAVRCYDNDVRYRRVILLVILGAQSVISMVGHGWGPLAPFLKKVMVLTNTELGLISSTFYLATALCALPAGIVVDRYGVRKGLIGWLGLTSFPLLVLGLVHQSFIAFLVVVAAVGLGYSFGNPVASKALFVWFHKRMRATVFGLRQSVVAVGGAVAAVLLVHLSQRTGPFMALRIVWCIVMVTLILSLLFYRSPRGVEDTPTRGTSPGRWSFRSGLRGSFVNKSLLSVAGLVALLGLSQSVVATFFLLYINERMGYALILAGSLYTILLISGAAGRIFWGVLSDRLFGGGRKQVLMAICVLGILSVTALAMWSNTWPDWLLVPVAVAMGISVWGWHGVGYVVATESADSNTLGTAVGLVATFAWFGRCVGPTGFGSITDHLGYGCGWMFLAACCSFAFFLCFLLPGSEMPAEEDPNSGLSE